jgi:hypothetical protein
MQSQNLILKFRILNLVKIAKQAVLPTRKSRWIINFTYVIFIIHGLIVENSRDLLLSRQTMIIMFNY